MVHGKPLTVIFSFALPLLVGNLFNQLYNVVDTAIVGRALYEGNFTLEEALAATRF